MTNEKKKDLVKDGPLLDFKKKLMSNLPTQKPKQPVFAQKTFKKVTGRGR